MIVPALALLTMFTIGSAGPPPDSLTAAKELYASAAYDDALAMLTRLSATAPSDEALQIEEYQSLCLYALGRTADAVSAVRALIQHDPLFELQADDASPRVQAMFADVRKGLLPQIAKERYLAAKTEMEAKQYASAESHLAEVRKIIDEAQTLGVTDSSLDDLGTLADGFRELAVAETTRAAAAAKPPSTAATASAPVSAPKAPAARTIFDANDPDVTPPVGITEAIPAVPTTLISEVRDQKGVLALTIAPDGHVETATMRQPFKNPYDQMVLSAAKTWRYRPALKAGVPVRYVMTIELSYKSQ